VEAKNREWVILRGASSIDDAFSKASEVGDAVIATQFRNGFFALMHKPKEQDCKAPDGCEFRACTKGERVGKNAVYEVLKVFLNGNHKTSIKCEETNEIAFNELKDHVNGMSTSELEQFIRDAEMAKTKGRKTPIYHACLTWKSWCTEELKMMKKSEQIVVSVSDVVHKWPQAFKDFVPQLEGIFLCPETREIKRITLEKALDDGLYADDLWCFIGLSNAGKTTLCTALGAYIADDHDFTKMVVTDVLDPLGITSRNGLIARMGAFVFSDLDLTSCKDTKLSHQEKKRFMKVFDTCGFKARQHPVTLPRFIPRLLSLNPGISDGLPAYEDWFVKQQLVGAAALAKEDKEALKKLSEDEMAATTHIIIWKVTQDMRKIQPAVVTDKQRWLSNRKSKR